MPYSGFQGTYVNQQNGANDYVRKHNPLVSYDAVGTDVNRLAKTKNFTLFDRDLANDALPQWMFITPNMSKYSPTAAAWLRSINCYSLKPTTATIQP